MFPTKTLNVNPARTTYDCHPRQCAALASVQGRGSIQHVGSNVQKGVRHSDEARRLVDVAASLVGHQLLLCGAKAHAGASARPEGVRAQAGANSVHQEFDVINGVAGHNSLVKVGIEGHLLHVGVLAHLDEGLTGGVGAVEHLLQDVQHLVCCPVLPVPPVQVRADGTLTGHVLATLAGLCDGFASHAARLGSEVDALTRALGHIASSVTNQGDTALVAPGAGVLRDGVCLNTDDLPTLSLPLGAVTGGLLVLLDGSLVHHGAGAHSHVVVLGEHPAVKIGRHIIPDVHLCQVLVVLHLVVRDPDALLEGDGVIEFAGVDELGHAAVGTVSADHHVNLHAIGLSGLAAILVVVEVDSDGAVTLDAVKLHRETVDELGAIAGSAVAQEIVKDLTPTHANVLCLAKGLAHVNLAVGGADHLHLGDLAVNDLLREVEFLNHAQRDGATARLAVVKLALN
mmetsp:Transcript_22559/g.62597  ORF Transcript_22559/g.62597 Transcript_22559/m.62597 type:complete len:456 (+) Transcript_22559:3741-5108(+)